MNASTQETFQIYHKKIATVQETVEKQIQDDQLMNSHKPLFKTNTKRVAAIIQNTFDINTHIIAYCHSLMSKIEEKFSGRSLLKLLIKLSKYIGGLKKYNPTAYSSIKEVVIQKIKQQHGLRSKTS